MSRFLQPLRLVHGLIRKPVRVAVLFARDVLERDPADAVGEEAGAAVQRLQPFVLDLVHPAHLLNEQERIRSNVHGRGALIDAPVERRQQSAVFRDVVRRMLKSDEPALRMVGATGLASRPTPSWQGTVRELLQASHPVIRLEAAALIAQYEPDAARAALDRLATDENPSVRVQAARVLAERVAGDFATLRKLMKSGDLLARVRAAGRILELIP